MKNQITMFDTEVTNACDEVCEASQQYKDAKDHLDCAIKHCAEMMKKNGLADQQFIRHEYNGKRKKIILKEGKVIEDRVSVKDDKDT